MKVFFKYFFFLALDAKQSWLFILDRVYLANYALASYWSEMFERFPLLSRLLLIGQ
jgi:hypothetical protein